MLRDVPAPVVAPVPVNKGKKTLLPPPPSPSPDLVRLLGDDEARIRRRSALAVAEQVWARGYRRSRGCCSRTPIRKIRQMAAFALGLIGDTAAVEPLKLALTDPSLIVAGRAAEALGLIGDALVSCSGWSARERKRRRSVGRARRRGRAVA